MKFKLTIILILSVVVCNGQTNNSQKYLGQKTPSTIPEIFAPEIISKKNGYEFGSIFNKAGTEFYYGVDVNGKEELWYSKLEGGKWSEPEAMLVHEHYGYNDPFLTNDENKLFFISRQALDGKGNPKDYDIWYVERTNKGWSEPINAGTNINTNGNEYYISFTDKGAMYFASNRRESDFDIYYSDYKNDEFQEPVRLGDSINTTNYEADVFIAPDESYIIFCANRPEGFGRGDLYVSFKKADGTWTNSKNMGDKINSEGHELCPFVSKDGKYFFYSSKKDIYWVSTVIINEMRDAILSDTK